MEEQCMRTAAMEKKKRRSHVSLSGGEFVGKAWIGARHLIQGRNTCRDGKKNANYAQRMFTGNLVLKISKRNCKKNVWGI